MSRVPGLVLIAAFLASGNAAGETFRSPQALILSEGFLLVGNRSGSVSVLDPVHFEVLSETPAGGDITSLVALGTRVLAVDHAEHRLHLLRTAPDGTIRVESSPETCRYPVRAAVSGSNVAISCLWPRQVRIMDAGDLRVPKKTVELPFEPRDLLFLAEDRLLVADGFGGGLALLEDGAIRHSWELDGHQLRGMALLAGETVAVAHQQLHSGMRTTSDDIRWGVFITNSVSLFPLDDLIADDPRMARRTRLLDLGGVVIPSGDPAHLVLTGEDSFAVSLSGVGRVAFGNVTAHLSSHVEVGEGPGAMLADGERLFVANRMDDSVSVLDLEDGRETVRIALGPKATLDAVARGERLFHDASLSLRGWMSCASCHVGGHTNHRLSDTLGDGGYGAPKRVLSLLGVRETRPYAWSGKVRSLEDQIRKSVRTTLRGRPLTEEEVSDLASYLRSLELPEPEQADRAAFAAGSAAFVRYECDRCHKAPTFTSAGAHDVGLEDESGERRFNAPSLLGVRFRRTLFHDASARSLEEVLARHPGHGVEIAESDLAALIAYLKSL